MWTIRGPDSGAGAGLGACAVSSGAACVAEEQKNCLDYILPSHPPTGRNSNETVPVTRLLLGALGPYKASSSAADLAGQGVGADDSSGAPGASEEQKQNAQYM